MHCADTDVLDATAASDLIEHLKNQGVLVFHSISNAYEFAAATDLPNGHDRWGNFPADRASWVLATKGQAMSAVELAGPPSSGDVILFGGRMWRVSSISKRTVNLVLTSPVANPIHVQYSDAPPLVPASMAATMRSIIT